MRGVPGDRHPYRDNRGTGVLGFTRNMGVIPLSLRSPTVPYHEAGSPARAVSISSSIFSMLK